MGKLRRYRPSASLVISIIALFVALTGGAVALQGKNSVDSGDIKKNGVKSSDIKSPNGVKSGDVANDKLSGDDIDESSLGEVRSAANADNAENAEEAGNADRLDGVRLNSIVTGASSAPGGCDPNSTTFTNCATVTLDLPRAGRVLGWADLQWHSDGSAPTRSECQMRVDGTQIGQGMFFGETDNTIETAALQERGAGGSFITSDLTAAPHTFSLDCNEPDSDIDIDQASISVLLLGTS
jgi:hypothetical protein